MSQRLTISIAMTTYNGERFLQEQLDSFLRQTRLPDELVVCDDGSQDRTVDILEAFAGRAPFTVRIYKNHQNLGFSKNFEKSMTLCEGDIIAFSDQDDVWLPEKLSFIENVFINYASVVLVFNNAIVANQDLAPLGYTLWDVISLSRINHIFNQTNIGEFIIKNDFIYGHLISVRKCLLSELFPIPNSWTFDWWIPFMASLYSDIYALPDALSKYRQHSNQCFGTKKLYLIQRITNLLKYSKKIYQNKVIMINDAIIFLHNISYCNQEILYLINEKKRHYEVRCSLPKARLKRLPIIYREYLINNYYRFNKSTIKSILMDLLI